MMESQTNTKDLQMKGRTVVAAPCKNLLAVKTTANGNRRYKSLNLDLILKKAFNLEVSY